jgi:DNA-binding NarL/FixJ family response regulator
MNAIRILLVDDHPLLRLGVRRSLENETGFSVTGNAPIWPVREPG